MSPTADFDVSITVPAGIDVLASGESDLPGHWSAAAVRDFAVSLGRFRTATGVANAPGPVQVTVGIQEGIEESPDEYLGKAVGAVEQLAQRFGDYPWDRLTLALTPGLDHLSIEYPGHIMLGADTQALVQHEVAHQWFYALVGNNQGRDPWLDEALATYAAARLAGTLDELRTKELPAEAQRRVGEPMSAWGDLTLYFSGIYSNGAQALLALGDPALVDCALKRYSAIFAHRIATSSDFVDVVSAVLPQARSILSTFGVGA